MVMKKKYYLPLFLCVLIIVIVAILHKSNLAGIKNTLTKKNIGSEKIDCQNIESYKKWLTSLERGLLEKEPSVGYHLVEQVNIKSNDRDYSIYTVSCKKEDVEAALIVHAVLFYTEDGFSKLSYIGESVGVSSGGNFGIDSPYREVVVSVFNGIMCWTCDKKEIVQLSNNGAISLTNSINDNIGTGTMPQRAVTAIEDLDGDDTQELVVTESKWEMAFGLCHACSPVTERYYKWSVSEFEDVSTKYKDLYLKQIDTAKQNWEERECGRTDKIPADYCTGFALKVLLASDMAGRRNEGWKFFWANTNPEVYRKIYGNIPDPLLLSRKVLLEQYTKGENFSPPGH